MKKQAKKGGWKPIPVLLKVVFVLSVLWSIGSIFAVQQRFELGVPLFGKFVYGVFAILIVLVFDIIAPLSFLYATWKRKMWGPKVAFFYMGFFIINSLIALITVSEQLGGPAILMPAIVEGILFFIVYKNRNYFDQK